MARPEQDESVQVLPVLAAMLTTKRRKIDKKYTLLGREEIEDIVARQE